MILSGLHPVSGCVQQTMSVSRFVQVPC